VINTEISKQKLKPYRTEEELTIAPQQACPNAKGKLRIVMNYEPWKPPPKPKPERRTLRGIDDIPQQPTPFCLRSLSTEQDHRLWNVTFIGRSEKKLRDGIDLRLDSDDVSGIHAAIEIYGDKLRDWIVQVTDESSTSGTEVDGVPVVPGQPVAIGTGNAIRFGRGQIWILERKALKPRSRLPRAQDTLFAENEYSLHIDSLETLNTLLRCPEWVDFTEVVLERLNLLNEAPCADYIEIRDESEAILSTHQITTPEEMNDYNMADVLVELQLGGRVMFRLTSDPYLLAPMVERHRLKKEELQKRLEEREDLPE
jgi:pSer/pThr/pTyr-binding forkhead associated (FHA) protein